MPYPLVAVADDPLPTAQRAIIVVGSVILAAAVVATVAAIVAIFA